MIEARESELLQAQSELQMEMGRQQVAEQDLQLAGVDSLSENQRSLVLRKPQLNAVRATIKAAQAAIEQGELELSRTTIKAPFDAHILSQNVSLGSQVSPGDDLGRLVGSEHYWITLAVPVRKLQWLNFTDSGEKTESTAIIRNTTAWPKDIFREGYLEKQVGALDDQTRLARVLVRVPDPLAREKEREDLPELMIGAFVEVQLQGKTISNVVQLNRDYVRTNQTVWVMEEGKLSIRDVEIVVTDEEYAYISGGLYDEEKVIISNLSTVAEGIDLRTRETDSDSDSNIINNDEKQVTEE